MITYLKGPRMKTKPTNAVIPPIALGDIEFCYVDDSGRPQDSKLWDEI